MRFIKQSTRVVQYNRNSDLNDNDEDIKFIDVIDLLYNKFYLQILVNNFIIHIKKDI